MRRAVNHPSPYLNAFLCKGCFIPWDGDPWAIRDISRGTTEEVDLLRGKAGIGKMGTVQYSLPHEAWIPAGIGRSGEIDG